MADAALEALTEEQLQQSQEFLLSVLRTEYPTIDLSVGTVLHDLLLRATALLHAREQVYADRLRRSQSMLEISADPTLDVDEQAIERILANYRITRNPGSSATGLLSIILSGDLSVSVEQGTVFTAGGLSYTTARAYVSVLDAEAVVSEQQRLLVDRGDGTWAFTVPVSAVSVGPQSRALKDTRFTATPAIPGVIDIVAAQDFTGGTPADTNAALVTAFKQSLSPKTFGGRIHIESLLRSVRPLHDLSIIGFGDAEMARDRHNLFQMSTGGKADIYARTQDYPERKVLVKTATLVDPAKKRWQLALGRDDAPGFYAIEAIRPADSPVAGSFAFTETRGLDLTAPNGEFVPNIVGLQEGAYTRYQTAVLFFTDTEGDHTGLAVGATRDYEVEVLALPGIGTLQDYANDRGVRAPQADYLVRAPIPAFVTIQLIVRHSGAAPSVEAIQKGIADRVNAVAFRTGLVPVSVIHDAVYNAAGTGIVSVSPIEMLCHILPPVGQPLLVRDIHVLKAPHKPALGLSSRTVAFYATPAAIDVKLEKLSTLPV